MSILTVQLKNILFLLDQSSVPNLPVPLISETSEKKDILFCPQTQVDFTMIGTVARTLELVVPLMEHPSETFLSQLEEDAVKLILQHDATVITSCLALLGSIVNTVTKNYRLIKDCFNR